VARVDTESAKAISSDQEQRIIDNIAAEMETCHGLVVADYAEILGTGVVTDKVLAFLEQKLGENGKIAIGDSRLRVGQFKGLICVPNDYEAAMAAGIYQSHTSHEISDEVVIESGKILVDRLHRELYITRGEKGIMLFDQDGAYTRLPTVPLDGEIDPTGAGDTWPRPSPPPCAPGPALPRRRRSPTWPPGCRWARWGSPARPRRRRSRPPTISSSTRPTRTKPAGIAFK